MEGGGGREGGRGQSMLYGHRSSCTLLLLVGGAHSENERVAL